MAQKKYSGSNVLTYIFGLMNNKFKTKVDKVEGKGLSTNDYTTDEKNKLSGIEANANKYEHPTYTSKTSGLYKVTVDGTGHVSAAEAVQKKDITDLGIPGEVKEYTAATTTADGLMSKEDKSKLDSVDNNAQVNVIEEIQINGTAVDVSGKKVNISVPTNNNQLANGAGYQTAAEVQTIVNNASHLKRSIVDVLPDTSAADANTIYMVSTNPDSSDNKYVEWMVINGAWEKTGDTEVDLSGYVQDADLVEFTNEEIQNLWNQVFTS